MFLGEGIKRKIKFNLFEKAQDVICIICSTKNVFVEYVQIKKEAQKHRKNKLLCFCLGQTSKALVYESSQEGYMAWDVGHL